MLLPAHPLHQGLSQPVLGTHPSFPPLPHFETPCRRMWALLQTHAKICTASACPVPRCAEMRTARRQQASRQEEQRRAAYRAMLLQQQAVGGMQAAG